MMQYQKNVDSHLTDLKSMDARIAALEFEFGYTGNGVDSEHIYTDYVDLSWTRKSYPPAIQIFLQRMG